MDPVLLSRREVTQPSFPQVQSTSSGPCTAFCLDNGDHCVFGTNMDNLLESGFLFVNKRHVLKNTWDPFPKGDYARWISRYGSVTVNFISYQMVWSGMNEAGLMISTMSLNETQGPSPDERLPIQSPFWMQYQLDMHSTVEQVISSDSEIRLPESQVDHYLVCDRTGTCAVIEFLDSRLVYHTGKSLPVKALTNNTYEVSLLARQAIHQGGGGIW
jgi:penicillin V acylase-like amidase (Ntn superfamily)